MTCMGEKHKASGARSRPRPGPKNHRWWPAGTHFAAPTTSIEPSACRRKAAGNCRSPRRFAKSGCLRSGDRFWTAPVLWRFEESARQRLANKKCERTRWTAALSGLLSVLLTSRLWVVEAGAADWPMFRRGPALTGIAVGALPQKLSLLWSFKTGQAVRSSAAVVAGRVYIGSNDGNLYSLGLADGKQVWAAKTGGAVESSPLALDGKVYAGSGDGFLYALEQGNGNLDWKYQTGDKILGSPNWMKGRDTNLVLVGSYDFRLQY